jgi:hypothetical protein
LAAITTSVADGQGKLVKNNSNQSYVRSEIDKNTEHQFFGDAL